MRYYLPTQSDGILRRAWRRLTSRPVPKFPRVVFVETQAGCNGLCVFCPYTTHHHTLPKGRMDDELYAAIVEECAHYRFTRFSPFLINEPLLDPHLEERLTLAKQKLRHARITLTTNASLLDKERTERLIATEALYRITVSFQSVDKNAYEKSMPGLNFDVSLANTNYLIDYVRAFRGRRPKITVTMLSTSLTEPYLEQSLRYWRARGVEARWTPFENRGGTIEDANSLTPGRMVSFVQCVRPFRQACITFDGLMVLCCADYMRQVVLGDLNRESIYDIWNGPRLRDIREALLTGRGGELPLCASCRIAERPSR